MTLQYVEIRKIVSWNVFFKKNNFKLEFNIHKTWSLMHGIGGKASQVALGSCLPMQET